MARIVRKLFPWVNGTIKVTQPWERCSRNSAVCVNAVEWGHYDRGRLNQSPDENKLTESRVYVTNVGGYGMGGFGSGVMFYLHIESGTDINVMVTMAYLGECNTLELEDVVIGVDDRDVSGDVVIKR